MFLKILAFSVLSLNMLSAQELNTWQTPLKVETLKFGVGDSGGGNAVRPSPSDELIMQDLFMYDSDFQDETTTPLITVSNFAMTLGYDRIDWKALSSHPAVRFCNMRLNYWKSADNKLIELIEKSLKGAQWLYTPFYQEPMSALVFTETQRHLYPELETFSAAVYDQEFGVRLSAPIINKMGLKSMAAMMIHESLRHISIAYGIKFTDEKIAKITAAFILADREKVTLDSEEFLGANVYSELYPDRAFRDRADEIFTQLTEIHQIFAEANFERGLLLLGPQYDSISKHGGGAAIYHYEKSDDFDKINNLMRTLRDLVKYTPLNLNVDEKILKLLTNLLVLSWTTAIADLNSRTPLLVDSTFEIKQVFGKVLVEDVIRDIIAGKRVSGIPRRELKKIKKILDNLKGLVRAQLNSGFILRTPVNL